MTRYPCATAWTISAVTMPMTLLFASTTGAPLMCSRERRLAASCALASGWIVWTLRVIISLAITGHTSCKYIDLCIEQGTQHHQGFPFQWTNALTSIPQLFSFLGN